MSRKFGKFLLFSAVAGAAAYGAYRYLQTREQAPVSGKADDTDDDFDDFSEDLDEDVPPTKERAYVSLNLDKAEAFASEAFHKAKEVIADSVQQVKETVKSVTENQACPESSFTDLTNVHKSETAAKSDEPIPFQETVKDASAETEKAAEDTSAKAEEAEKSEETAPAEEEVFQEETADEASPKPEDASNRVEFVDFSAASESEDKTVEDFFDDDDEA